MRWGTRRRESGDSPGGGYQAGRPVPLPSMTTGAGQVLPQPTDDRAARLAARAGFGAGVAGALANMLLVAYAVLAFVRPGPVQAALWPLACAAAGASAVLLIPVVLVLGGGSLVSLGVASMAFSAVAFLMLITGLLAPRRARRARRVRDRLRDLALPRVPRRDRAAAGRARRSARGVAALVGTALLAAGNIALPTSSTAWLAVLVLGGIPAVLGWLAVPAWTPARGALAAPAGRAAPGGTTRTGRVAGGTTSPLRRLAGVGTIVSFHAHPDDEAIGTGGTLARAAAAGHRVVLVFATRGELGEPVPGRARSRASSWRCAAPPSATPRRRRSAPSAWSSSASPTPG